MHHSYLTNLERPCNQFSLADAAHFTLDIVGYIWVRQMKKNSYICSTATDWVAQQLSLPVVTDQDEYHTVIKMPAEDVYLEVRCRTVWVLAIFRLQPLPLLFVVQEKVSRVLRKRAEEETENEKGKKQQKKNTLPTTASWNNLNSVWLYGLRRFLSAVYLCKKHASLVTTSEPK